MQFCYNEALVARGLHIGCGRDMITTEAPPVGYFFSPEAWQLLAVRLQLSPRELEIVRGVCQNRKESSIAESLGLSRYTVRTYVLRLYAKLGVTSRVDLMLLLLGTFLVLTAQPGSPLPPICGHHTAGRCPLSQ